MTFEQAVEYVGSLAGRGWRMGLDRMTEFARRAGIGTVHSPRFIHVGGTNGKGSTTAYVQSILVDQGCRVGGFFSPFVVDLRERIQLNGEMISKDAFARHVSELRPIADAFDDSSWGKITEFEFKTALGLRFWEQEKCDFVALEVGMGGRLDATNIVHADVAVITSIGLDHVEHLGPTHEDIAREKAGIIKPGSTVVVGRMPSAALQQIHVAAQQASAQLWRLDDEIRLLRSDAGWTVETPILNVDGLVPGMTGTHQPANMALAVAACVAAGAVQQPGSVAASVKRTRLPARFDQFTVDGVEVIVDGAHNVDSARALCETLYERGLDRVVLVIGMLNGHDARDFISELAPKLEAAFATPIDFHRTMMAPEVAAAAQSLGLRASIMNDSSDAFESALARCKEAKSPMLVTGSFYLAGEIIRLIRKRALAVSDSAQK
jgi:dihydrofolate synthase/folylpolyglutamate synthase